MLSLGCKLSSMRVPQGPLRTRNFRLLQACNVISVVSRLSSYDLFASFTLAPLGAVVAGPAANAFGTSAVLTTAGLLIVVLTGAVLLIPEVRQMQRRVHAHPGQADTVTP